MTFAKIYKLVFEISFLQNLITHTDRQTRPSTLLAAQMAVDNDRRRRYRIYPPSSIRLQRLSCVRNAFISRASGRRADAC